MIQSAEDARIRGLRPPREQVDPWRPLGVLREQERTLDGEVPTLTVFLAGSECPFTCVFCDLWRFTLEQPTPEGAIPAQIELALEEAGELPPGSRIKLYNASNFFDRRAVPPADHPHIAALLAGFDRIVVECHPHLVNERIFEFSEMTAGRLEVAMGLETVHPGALAGLNKKMSKDDYDRATTLLTGEGIPHRAFVLVGMPFMSVREAVDWSVVSASYAIDRGAETVTLIPIRGGNGELERLQAADLFHPISLSDLESAFERSLSLPGEAIVQLDLWDLERLSGCQDCFTRRADRLVRMNLSGAPEPGAACATCGLSQP